MEAFEFFARVAAGEYPQPAAWHCSPPCQAYTAARVLWGREHPDLVSATRAALLAICGSTRFVAEAAKQK